MNRQNLRFDPDWYEKNNVVPRKVSLVVDDRFVLAALEKPGRYR